MYDQIRELTAVQGNLSIERMCQLGQVSRASFYRSLRKTAPTEEDMEVRSAIQSIVLEHRRRYGYRRVGIELRKLGMVINHKRILKIMREDNLLAVQPAAFVATTDTDHDLEVYLNLASRMELTGVNQLWVADITYVNTGEGWLYVAAVLDRWTRRCVGWAMGESLATSLPLAALNMALEHRQPPAGLIHHSDRGVQYACAETRAFLEQHGWIASMSRTGNPYDNAWMESAIGKIKSEVLGGKVPADHAAARQQLFVGIESWYNQRRRHSALGYQSPVAFETQSMKN